MKAIFYDNEV